MAQSRTYTVYELEAASGFDKRTITYYISEGLLPKVGRRGPKTTYPQEFLDRLMFIKRCRDLQDAGQLRAVTLAEIADVMQALPAEEFRAVAQDQRSDDWIRDRFVEPDWDTSVYSIPAERAADTDVDYDSRKALGRVALSRSRPMASMRERRDRLQLKSAPPAAPPSWSEDERPRPFDEPATEDSGEQVSASMQTPGALWSKTSDFGPAMADTSAELARLGELIKTVQERAREGAESTAYYSGERLLRVPITDDIMLSVRNIPERDAQLVEDLADLLRRIMRIT